MAALYAVFDVLMETLITGFAPQDRVGFELHAPTLDRPIWIPLSRRDQVTVDRILFHIQRVLQSKTNFVLDGDVIIKVIHIAMPEGSGRTNLKSWAERKHSVIQIKNKDDLCLARAIVTAKARLDKDTDCTVNWNNIRRGQCEQTRLAKELHRRAGVPEGPCGLDEVASFQAVLPEYQINVVTTGTKDVYLYRGPPQPKQLHVLYHQNHFDVMTSLPALVENSYFCNRCNKGYDRHVAHRCKNVCKCCFNAGKDDCVLQEWIRCDDCQRDFKNPTCFQNHLKPPKTSNITIKPRNKKQKRAPSICKSTRRCPVCCTTYKVGHHKHQCGYLYCRNCEKQQPADHRCYMQVIEKKEEQLNIDRLGDIVDDPEEAWEALGIEDVNPYAEEEEEILKYVFFDFECIQEDDDGKGGMTHVPNYCIAQRVCLNCIDDDDVSRSCETCGEHTKVFKGEQTLTEFGNWLLSPENRGATAIAHNMKGYDGHFFMQYAVRRGICPDVVMNGAKLMSITLKEPSRNKKKKKETVKLRIIDSANFIPAPLATFSKTFGLTELKKGHFPYLFNTRANQDYVGPWPSIEYYCPDEKKTKDRQALLKWYEEQKDKVFDMAKEMYEYCLSDVELLRRGCLAFRKEFLSTTEEDPFENCLTISMACMRVFRTKFLKPNTIALVPHGGYNNDTQSTKALKWLKWMEHRDGTRLRHARTEGGEKHFGPYKVDGWDETSKTAYEFYGCLWHGCPVCFPQRDQHLPRSEKTVEDAYEELNRRRAWLQREGQRQGFRIVETWECEFEETMKARPEMKTFIDDLPHIEPLQPRDAFFGGRTNAVKLHHVAAEDEQIRYIDICSLYPYVNKYCKYPIGHPEIIVDPPTTDVSGYEGLVKCTVLPPRGLYHPVLPYRSKDKLLFPLCATCAKNFVRDRCSHNDEERALRGTWVTVELKKAVEKGYRILHIDEVWHFAETRQYDPTTGEVGLFTEYIDTFLKMKQEASGWPKECDTKQKRREYISEYETHEGIRLEYTNIEKNEGKRALAKLMLNSFWGKFGQRSTLTKTQYVGNPETFFGLLCDRTKEVKFVTFDDTVESPTARIQWIDTDEYIEVSPNTNIFNAAYTTAHARMKLYSYIERLDDRVLYFDTDSVVYVHREGRWSPPTGNFLGDMTDELEKPYGSGSYIVEFVAGGPKNYAYRVFSGKTKTIVNGECKVRGITLNHDVVRKVNFDAMREMVKQIDAADGRAYDDETGEEAIVPVVYPHRIQRDGPGKVYTKAVTKKYRLVYDKRVIQPDKTTLPYGF